jgi:hypothetical protein
MLVPHENSYMLWQMLVNSDAYLHLYPDSGHGFLNEYHQHLARMVNAFLDEPEREDENWGRESYCHVEAALWCCEPVRV